MSSWKPKIKYLALTLLIMVFIFIQSALPADLSGAESNVIARMIVSLFHTDPLQTGVLVRKCAHFTEYLILGVSLILTVRSGYGESTGAGSQKRIMSSAVISWLIGAAYAATDEFHQRFVDGRSCELRDMMIDAAGVLLGVLITMAVYSLANRPAKPKKAASSGRNSE